MISLIKRRFPSAAFVSNEASHSHRPMMRTNAPTRATALKTPRPAQIAACFALWFTGGERQHQPYISPRQTFASRLRYADSTPATTSGQRRRTRRPYREYEVRQVVAALRRGLDEVERRLTRQKPQKTLYAFE